MMTASIKLMTWMMDGCLILNKLGRRRVKLSHRVMATLQCWTIEIWALLLGFSCPTPTLLLWAPVLLWLGEATHSELFSPKIVNGWTNEVIKSCSGHFMCWWCEDMKCKLAKFLPFLNNINWVLREMELKGRSKYTYESCGLFIWAGLFNKCICCTYIALLFFRLCSVKVVKVNKLASVSVSLQLFT